jgi:hypothetical protein
MFLRISVGYRSGFAVILGVAAVSLLAPSPATAIGLLDFNFSFSDPNGIVEGIIRGLEDGATTAPAIIEITGAPRLGSSGQYTFAPGNPFCYPEAGFTVLDGVITQSCWDGHGPEAGQGYPPSRPEGTWWWLSFKDPPLAFSPTNSGQYAGFSQPYRCQDPDCTPPESGGFGPVVTSLKPVFFTQRIQLNGVPGPLSLLGVTAAFGFSRKLRKRIKSSKLPVVSAIS